MTAHDARAGAGCARIVGLPALIVILCQVLAGPAAALDWEFEDVDIRFDTTLSQRVMVRKSERDLNPLSASPTAVRRTPSTTTTAESPRTSPDSPAIWISTVAR